MIADAAGSVGVMVAGVLIILTGQPIWDVVVAALIAVFVIIRAVVLGRQVIAVLGQHAPEGVDPEDVAGDLDAVEGVEEVHDLHLWTLTSGMNVATAHLVADQGADHGAVLAGARRVLRDRYGIAHATLQVEGAGSDGCHDLSW
ncbi:cation diffusion facilitator family transporter [Micrococcus aloeverae]|uniref:Cation diffusion facilitator family transporter n=1 Tax=Micrococcus aloeverae TaxID=1391911 RepID=A0ABR6E0R9_9MICC|nr:cation diffusion facilitator family transporter [Micrococcus aloeverae]